MIQQAGSAFLFGSYSTRRFISWSERLQSRGSKIITKMKRHLARHGLYVVAYCASFAFYHHRHRLFDQNGSVSTRNRFAQSLSPCHS